MVIVRHKSIGKQQNEPMKRFQLESANIDDLYGQWSQWSKCRKRCKQIRTRKCMSHLCESTILKEERDCSGHLCVIPSTKIKASKISANRPHEHSRQNKKIFRVLYHLQRYIYSPWSEWAACKTRTCHTSRYRVCMNSVICKNSIIKEDALCYTPGSECENKYKLQVNSEPEAVEEIEQGNHVISNVSPVDDNQCGIVSRHTTINSMLRIIGGRRSRHGRWPWMVAILNRQKQHYCGGTLVSPQFVITAGKLLNKFLLCKLLST